MNPDKAKAVPEHVVKWLASLALAFITLAVYLPVLHNAFIDFDDLDYVTQNAVVQQGLSWNGVAWAFGTFSASNWHPLTWLSHELDCQLYGLAPAGHHFTSVLLHAANTVLLFLLLHKLTGRLWSSAVVALLFGIHPMHVESVAWVAERKDVLSGFFFLLTLLAYAHYVQKSESSRQKVETGPFPSSILHSPSSPAYFLCLCFFALGLMSKPMVVTLPCLLCFLDYWPLKRFTLHDSRFTTFLRLLLEKIPFFALAAASCVVTVLAQSKDAVRPMTEYPLAVRLTHLPVACIWYLQKLFWPTHLSVFYPLRPSASMVVVGALALVVVLTWLVCRSGSRWPWLLVGWFWFLIMLLPVVGLIQVGDQAYADRYTYLPYIGLFIILVWGCQTVILKWPHGRALLTAATLLAGLVLAGLASEQVRAWRDNQTLFSRSLAASKDNQFMWAGLGLEAVRAKNQELAVHCYRQSTLSDGNCFVAWNGLGGAYFVQRKFSPAQYAYQMALHCDAPAGPSIGTAYYNLGNLYLVTGRVAAAATNFQKALEFLPDNAVIYRNLGGALARMHEPEQALIQFQNALRLQPVNPDSELALAQTFVDNQQPALAINHLYQLLVLDPDSVGALNNLAWLLATSPDPAMRDGAEAVHLAEHACQLTGRKQAVLLGTLAAAYAEVGRYQEAAATAEEARVAALAHGQPEVAARNEQLRNVYRSGRPFHQEKLSNP